MDVENTVTAVELGRRLSEVKSKIGEAARRGRRSEEDVLILAVTKTHPPEIIRAAYAAGLRHFGENRVVEAQEKLAGLPDLAAGGAEWHMIGSLQSRKADAVAGLFGWIHSVDRLKVARKLEGELSASKRRINALLEVNLSGEKSKSGFDLSGWPNDTGHEGQFFKAVEAIIALPSLECCGLMTIPPYDPNPESARPIFARLSSLLARLQDVFPAADWRHLSIGMSADYEVAVEEGATIVRLGTALFGPRRNVDT